MVDWRADKQATDPYLGHAAEIIGRSLIVPAPLTLDRQENTDLVMLASPDARYAVRIRSNSYEARYGDQFTLRSSRPSGAKTELQKVLDGLGDYLLYGFRSRYEPGRLSSWVFADLAVFRRWYSEQGGEAGDSIRNRDDSSWFRAFRIDQMPDDFIVERSGVLA